MVSAHLPPTTEIHPHEAAPLSKLYRHIVDALHEMATPEEICFEPDQASAMLTIINGAINRIHKLLPLHGHAVLLVSEEMELTPYICHPSDQCQQLATLTQHWLDDGRISWALNQNRAVVIHSDGHHDTAILHAIAVRNRVMGLFIGFTTATIELDEAILSMISVVLLNCCNTLEACELHYQLRQYNDSLEQQVQQRTRQLELARQRAEESVRDKSLFLATMSHELRTPMNGVIGMAQLLASTTLDEKQHHFVNTILHSARALTALINDILDLSRIEAGRLSLDSHPFDFGQMAANVVELLAPQLGKKPVDINLVHIGASPLHVRGDSARLRQILINLLGNAIKFTERGAITLQISAKEADGELIELHVNVSDSGIGIAEESLASLFTPYIQAESATWREYGGTGLGLAICKQLLEQMGGTIGVTSRLNEGSTFWFEISLPQVNERDVQQWQAGTNPTSAQLLVDSAPHDCSRRKPRILVAEDNPVNQEVISHMLEALECQVKIAENGQEAIYFLARSSFDLLLMDYHMPILDGGQALQYIRSTPGRNQRIPIVMLTASTQPEDLKQFRNAGMDDFLAKPVEQTALARMINKWLHMEPDEAEMKNVESSPPSSPERALLDEAIVNNLRQLMGEGFAPLRQTFINNSRQKLQQLQQAVTNSALDDIKLLAHSLKGSCGTIGATAMADQARSIEDAIKANQCDRLSLLTDELEQLFTATVIKLEEFPTP